MLSDTALQVFVDDDSPEVVYQGRWTQAVSLPTDLKSLNVFQSLHSPWYGTLHTPHGSSGLSYIFNGTAITAMFLGRKTGFSVITSCMIDGVNQLVVTNIRGVSCLNNTTLPAGTHNLSMTFQGDRSLSFDGLLYTPTEFPDSGVDVQYQFDNDVFSTNLLSLRGADTQVIGDNGFDFEFHGVSIGVYCTLLFLSTAPVTPLSYFIDDGKPVKFNISNPSKSMGQLLDMQLVLQTPPLPRGPHTLHMTVPGQVTGNGTQMVVRAVVVQNGTNPSLLDIVPSISSAITSLVPTTSSNHPSPLSSKPHISKNILIMIGSILGCFIAATFILLVVFLKRRSLRKKTGSNSTATSTIIPFSVQRDNRAAIFILSQHIVAEKLDRYRKASEHSTGDERVSSEEEHANGRASESRDSPSRLRRVRYRVHEDAGEANHVAEEDEEDVIVSLPPVYRPNNHLSVPPGISASNTPPTIETQIKVEC